MRSIITALAVATLMTLSLSPSVEARGYDSAKNKPSYWGENCVKFENFNGNTFSYSTTNQDVTKVIIKGGTKNAVYESGSFTNLSSPINDRNNQPYGISHVIECYGDGEVLSEDEQTDDRKVWICHWTEGIRGYIKINVSINGAENGHLGEHHHHNQDFIVSESEECESGDVLGCQDDIYFQHNQDICVDDEDSEEPNEPEDNGDVLGETDPGKGGDNAVLADTGVTETAVASIMAGLLASGALAAVRMSTPSKEELLSQIAL